MEGKLTKSRIFLYSGLFFILGVGVQSLFKIPLFFGYLVFLGSLIILILGWRNQRLWLLGWLGLALFLGFWRYELSLPQPNANRIDFYNGQKIELIGVVTSEPDVRQDQTKLTVSSSKLKINQPTEIKVNGKVLVKTGLYPEYAYGDRLVINCELTRPEKIEDFNYDQYLAKEDIYSLCYQAKIKKIGSHEGNPIIDYLLRAKDYFIKIINRILPEPQASFLAGLLVGARRSIPAELTQAFNRTGTTHIIAISGYNITIIAGILISLAKGIGLGRKKSFWFIAAGIIFFVIITGAQASVIRAALMGFLVLLAGRFGRLSQVKNALVLAALVMLVINPKILVFDVGFQLSFLATIGLIFLSPILESYSISWPELYGIKGSLVTTVSAIILTTPLIIYQFGRFSLVAPLANVLVLPLIPWAMAWGFLAGVAGLVWWPLGWILGWLVWLILSYIILVIEGLGGLKWASIEIGGLPSWLMFLIYSLIVIWLWRNSISKKNLLVQNHF